MNGQAGGPRHYVHHHHEYRDGYRCDHESEGHFLTAAEARDERVARLREAKRPHTVDGLTVTYDDTDGVPADLQRTITLTWRDA